MTSASIKAILLPTRAQAESLQIGEFLVASGWGYDSDSASQMSTVLKFVSIPLLNNSACVARYGAQYVRSTNICTSGTGGKGIW